MDVKDVKQGLACCGQDHMDEDEYFYVQDCEECPWNEAHMLHAEHVTGITRHEDGSRREPLSGFAPENGDARHEHCAVAMMREARETIERLEKRIAELEAALEGRKRIQKIYRDYMKKLGGNNENQ